MKTVQKVRLVNPCGINIDKEELNACGFHCSSCKKEVVDFRGMTTAEFGETIRLKGAEQNCGVFRESQLAGKRISWLERIQMLYFRQKRSSSIFAKSMMILTLMLLAGCVSQKKGFCGGYSVNEIKSNGNLKKGAK